MAESYLKLGRQDQRDALLVAAQVTGRPAALLEKDIWVAWALDTLFQSELEAGLVFKGGTSLSKAYGLIDRFSEDVDITYDMRRLIPGLAQGRELPTSRSQADRWSAAVAEALPAWMHRTLLPCVERAAVSVPGLQFELQGTNLLVHYPALVPIDPYVRPRVLLEFGARSSGEPAEMKPIACDAAAATELGIRFPSANVRAMLPTRTFWEKATAAHVYCQKGAFRGGLRWSRHWYDIVALERAGVVRTAVADRRLAEAVASHKTMFFREADVDYSEAVGGQLRLVPPVGEARDTLEADFERMSEAGMFFRPAPSFDALLDACREIEAQANAAVI